MGRVEAIFKLDRCHFHIKLPCGIVDLCGACGHEISLPVVPHKAVAEVSKIGNYRRGELL